MMEWEDGSQIKIGAPGSAIPSRFEDAYRELQAISIRLKPAQGTIPDVDQIEPYVQRAKELAAYCQERIDRVRRLVDDTAEPS